MPVQASSVSQRSPEPVRQMVPFGVTMSLGQAARRCRCNSRRGSQGSPGRPANEGAHVAGAGLSGDTGAGLVGIAQITGAGAADRSARGDAIGGTRLIGGPGADLVGIARVARAGAADGAAKLTVSLGQAWPAMPVQVVGIAQVARAGVADGAAGSRHQPGSWRGPGAGLVGIAVARSGRQTVVLGSKASPGQAAPEPASSRRRQMPAEPRQTVLGRRRRPGQLTPEPVQFSAMSVDAARRGTRCCWARWRRRGRRRRPGAVLDDVTDASRGRRCCWRGRRRRGKRRWPVQFSATSQTPAEPRRRCCWIGRRRRGGALEPVQFSTTSHTPPSRGRPRRSGGVPGQGPADQGLLGSTRPPRPADLAAGPELAGARAARWPDRCSALVALLLTASTVPLPRRREGDVEEWSRPTAYRRAGVPQCPCSRWWCRSALHRTRPRELLRVLALAVRRA